MIFTSRKVLIPADVTRLPVVVDCPGSTFVQCAEMDTVAAGGLSFKISVDEGANWIPFGPAREFYSRNSAGEPVPFSRLLFNTNDAFDSAAPVLVFGSGDYRDNRVTLAPGQKMRAEPFNEFISRDVVLVGFPSPGTDFADVGSLPGSITNFKNTHATATIRLVGNLTDYNAGRGFPLDPGADIDIPFRGRMYFNGPVGAKLTYSQLSYFG